MASILHNTTFVIIYVIVAAVYTAIIIILDMKQIRQNRKYIEAVEENTRTYDRLLDEAERSAEALEQHNKEVELYREAVNRNTRLHEKLIRQLEQD